MTPEQIQELINASVASAFTSMGINGQDHPTSPSSWYINSWTSIQMTSMETNLSSPQPYTKTEQIMVMKGQNLSISNFGSIAITTPTTPKCYSIQCSFVPNLSTYLISIGKLVDNGC